MKVDDIKVCVLRIEGTNGEQEARDAFRMLGADPEMVHLKQLIGDCPSHMKRNLDDYHILMIPGGASAGDYVRAGAIFAARIRDALAYEVENFVSSSRPILGVGNGFQVLVELGLLPSLNGIMDESPQAALHVNQSNRFECRPTYLKHENHGRCVFTSHLPRGEVVMFPCAHAEGRLMFPAEQEQDMLRRLEENDQIVFRYVDGEGGRPGHSWNPSGSLEDIAGICNPEGNVLGLMPHPERVVSRYQHPDWTREHDPDSPGDGRAIFSSVLEHLTRRS